MRRLLIGTTIVSFAASASAQDQRPDYGPPVNAAGGKKIAAGVVAECQKNGWNIAVAVVDTHGSPCVLRAHGQHAVASIDIAMARPVRGDLSPPDARVHGRDQQGRAGDSHAAGRLRLAQRSADHGRRQGHRRRQGERRPRRPGRQCAKAGLGRLVRFSSALIPRGSARCHQHRDDHDSAWQQHAHPGGHGPGRYWPGWSWCWRSL